MTESSTQTPNRDHFRQERRAAKAAARRRRLIGVPLVAVAFGLVGAGVYVIVRDQEPTIIPVEVQSETTIRGDDTSTTSDSNTTTTAFADTPAEPAELMPENVEPDLSVVSR